MRKVLALETIKKLIENDQVILKKFVPGFVQNLNSGLYARGIAEGSNQVIIDAL